MRTNLRGACWTLATGLLLTACGAPPAPGPTALGTDVPGNEPPRSETVEADPVVFPCELTVHTETTGALLGVTSTTTERYTLDERLRPLTYRGPESVFRYTYEGDVLVLQVSDVGVGRYPVPARLTYALDGRGYVVKAEHDLERDGQVERTFRYLNTYDARDLRERTVDASIDGQKSQDRQRWTPENEPRTVWRQESFGPARQLLAVERYGVAEGKLLWRELDLGGDGVDTFEDHTQPPAGSLEVQVERDEVGRPLVVRTSTEEVRFRYEDGCGGVPVPQVHAEPGFRLPGT